MMLPLKTEEEPATQVIIAAIFPPVQLSATLTVSPAVSKDSMMCATTFEFLINLSGKRDFTDLKSFLNSHICL